MEAFKSNEWKTLAKVGGGRFSDIYRISKKNENNVTSYYALKIVDPDDIKPPHNIRNEIKILNDLKHAQEVEGINQNNVIVLQDVLFNKVEYGLIFPYYDMTLNNCIKEYIKSRSKFNLDGTITQIKINTIPINYVKSLTKGILNGLKWIHSQNIIHRDINPNNILISKSDLNTPVIIDFGISYQLPNNNGLESSEKKFTDIATGLYKAPELLLSKRDYNNKVDIWALGIILTLLLSNDGEPIFEKDAMYSDLVLLSNIISTFGSPPIDWSDCHGLVSFDSLNRTFFTKPPKPLKDIVPKLFIEEDEDTNKLKIVFEGLVKYETSSRLSASDALELLC
jgi:serine/threonine-protein kinase CAK1